MQNIHLINSYQCPINEYQHHSSDFPIISSLYGESCKLLFPNLQGEPICVFFSDLLNKYLVFYEDEIYIAGEEEPYLTLDFLVNFACVSKSGDYAILATAATPSEIYIFDIDQKDVKLIDLTQVCNFNSVESCQGITNTSQSSQCDQNEIEKVLCASFRQDNAFCAIATNNFIQTISEQIPEQQGIYNQNVVNPTGITWNDQGSWLAFSTGNRVVFLEKNCRIRQIYELDNPEAQIIALEWSPHRDIIAIMDTFNRIIILSMKNRVFYRKYVINLTPRDDNGNRQFIPQLFWSNDSNNLSLAVIEAITSTVSIYEFNFTVDKDNNSIYVIDGDKLLISDWSRALIPPPLSHRKEKFSEENQFNQITAIASNNEEIAVFSLDTIHMLNSKIYLPLPVPSKEHIYRPSPIPAQCASFISQNELVFACHDILYKLTLPDQSGQFDIVEIYSNPNMKFISFVTPTFIVTSRATISLLDDPQNPINNIQQQITEFVENPVKSATSQLDYIAFCHKDGFLYRNDKKIANGVESFIFFDKLLAYNFVSPNENDLKLGTHGWMCKIQYGNESSTRQIEPLSQLLYFTPRIYSIITLMNRGNIEVNAPHVVVEAALRELIKEHQYAEAWRLAKKYQVPFNRLIMLGEIDLSILCTQISDKELRSCMSALRPFGDDAKINNKQEQTQEGDSEKEKEENAKEERTFSVQEKIQMQHQMAFVLNFLSFILNVKVEYNQIQKTLIIPEYEPNQQNMIDLPTTCCICFILLQSPQEAVRFACSFSSSEIVKRSISFLLALYDNDELYDISLKTYDTNCMASVGLITMKEPSLYVPFIEELNQITNENLKKAKIDEKASDPKSAVIHYALAGPEYDENSLYLIKLHRLFDVGLHAYNSPQQREIFLQIIQMKLDYLTSLSKKEREQEKNIKEIAKTAILSESADVILQHIAVIVKANSWQLALPILNRELDSEEKQIQGYRQIRDALETAKMLKDAADFTIHYLPNDKEDAIRIYLQNHDWYKSIEVGADRVHVAEEAYQTLMLEATRKAEAARTLKAKFDNVKEKQKIHKDSNIRHGKNKEKRGLPAILVQLMDLLPNENKKTEFMQIIQLLEMVGEDDKKQELGRAFRDLVRAVWPIPNLPMDERIALPSYLEGFT